MRSSPFRSALVLVVALVAASFFAGCTTAPESPLVRPEGSRYLALGDSYTIGESVEPARRWPVQLADRLREEGVDLGPPWIIARTGWTTDELAAGIAERYPWGSDFDLVTLLIGVNNQYRGRDVEAYREELRSLLRRSIAFVGGREERVIVVSIPDWGVMPFAEGRDRAKIAREIDLYNRVKREEAESFGVRFVDITPGSRRAATDPSLVAADGLHPSGALYTEWVAAVLPAARAALGVAERAVETPEETQ